MACHHIDIFSTKNGRAIAAFQIYMTTSNILKYEEFPDYPKAQFLSDIGGAAGLCLGMSFASLIGIIDCLLSYIFRWIKYVCSIATVSSSRVFRRSIRGMRSIHTKHTAKHRLSKTLSPGDNKPKREECFVSTSAGV